jgi:hypothetical protein
MTESGVALQHGHRTPREVFPVTLRVHDFPIQASYKLGPALQVQELRVVGVYPVVVEPEHDVKYVKISRIEGESFSTTIPHRKAEALYESGI